MPVATCGTVSVQSLDWPLTCAVPQEKSTLPKGLFAKNVQLSDSTKKTLVNTVEAIRLLAIASPKNTALTAGTRVPEVLVIGLPLAQANAPVPAAVVELIASQRKSGIIFVCTKQTDSGEQAALAVRRKMPSKPGHPPVFETFTTEWMPTGDITIPSPELVESIDELWDAACAQVALGSPDVVGSVDEAIAKTRGRAELEKRIAKLTKDHQRAKNQQTRNELFHKLRQAKQQLADLA